MTYRPYDKITSSSIELRKLNESGSLIPKGTPVRETLTGGINTVNPSIESEVFSIIGVTAEDIVAGAYGKISSSGLITDITTTFNFGDMLFLSKTGTLTNIKPSIGVDGFLADDYVVRIGVLSQNQQDAAKKDIFIGISLIGKL